MSGRIVIGVAGSPRAGGNSDRLLAEFLAGVASCGVETRSVAARDLPFAACDGCGACSSSGECVHRDGAAELLAELDTAAGLVICSPVYFAGVPAVLKALIDRMQPCWARAYRLNAPRRAKRPGAYILVGGGGDPFGTAGAEATLASAMQVCGFSVDVRLRYLGLDAPTDAQSRPGLLAQVRAEGAAFAARILKSSCGAT